MDDRGQPVQVGAILLFGFLIVAFSTYQAVVVPQQNEEVEFEHNLDAQSKMVELRGSLLRAGSTGDGYPVSVRLGTTYPARLIAVNPGPSSGSLRTVSIGGGADLNVTNARALDGETADFWNGDTVTYTTGGIAYEPNYNVYRQAPATLYENGVVYNRGPDGTNVTQTDQRLVDGRTLDLTVLQGSYQRSGSDAVSVGVSSPTAAPRTVLVNSSGDPINVSVPTGLSNATWARLLDDQLASNGGYVTSLEKTDGVLSIELDQTRDGQTVTYELRVPAASVGADVPEPTTAYVTDVSGDGATIPDSGSQQIVAEVRNEFNGPESGVETCAAVTRGPGSIEEVPTTDTSDADGRVAYTYVADDVPTTQTAVVTVGYECDGSDDPEPSAPPETKATFEIDVYDTGGGGGGGGGTSADNVQLTRSSTNSQTSPGTQETFEFTLENTGGSEVVIKEIAVDSTTQPDASQVEYGSGNEFEQLSGGSGALNQVLDIGGSTHSLDTDAKIAGGTTAEFRLTRFVDSSGGQVDMKNEDVTITIHFNDGSSKQFTLSG